MLDRLRQSAHTDTFLGALAIFGAAFVVLVLGVFLVVGAAVSFAWIAEAVS